MTDEENDKKKSLRFDLGHGETFTYDRGGEGPDIILTSSASANTALVALAMVPRSPIREAVITATQAVGRMSKKELEHELIVLSAGEQVPDAKFGSLPVGAVIKIIETELAARSTRHGVLTDVAIAGGCIVIGVLLGVFGLG